MADFSLNDLLRKRGIDIATTRLVRHDRHAKQAWLQGRLRFEHFVSFQNADRSPYHRAELILQFLPEGGSQALFVGAHRVVDSFVAGKAPANRQSNFFDPTSAIQPSNKDLIYDLERYAPLEDLVERVVIEWGSATRSWSQWAHHEKPLLDYRLTAQERPFPGYQRFSSTIDEIAYLPKAWHFALGAVKGVYLLVCPQSGEQYVGSATGEGGFLERWLAYAQDGHGGNVRLKDRERSNFSISILEVASSTMSSRDIVESEVSWKAKLGSRAHGLNAN